MTKVSVFSVQVAAFAVFATRMKLYDFTKILNLQSVIPGLTRNPVLSLYSGCPRIGVRGRLIRSGMTKADFLQDYQNFITQSLFFDQTEAALSMAQVIVDKSPAILFRRLAGENPRLVYVSDNINRLGYTAEEFLSGKLHFKDIVHPDDFERLGAEIRGYAEEDVEEYTQIYRVLSKSGEVRWVEDQTSVVRDAEGKKPITKAWWWTSPVANLQRKSCEKAKRNFAGLWRLF